MITKMVIHTGRDVHELTDPDILALRSWCQRGHRGTDAGLGLAWVLLRDIASLPEATMAEAVRLGQRSTIELVNRYRLRDSNVRKVLVRYLDERRPSLDHNTFQNLVNVLAGVFWADIEQHHPGLDTLHLPCDVAEAWKQRARTTISADGTRRDRGSLGYFQILDRVRAFYLDIQEWAMEDPSWAPWAAPARCGAARPTATAKHIVPSWRICTNACETACRTCPRSCAWSTNTAPIRPRCWQRLPQPPSATPFPTRPVVFVASPRSPTTRPNTAVPLHRCWWRTWPPASESTSVTPKTKRSGRGLSWKHCATPEFASRS